MATETVLSHSRSLYAADLDDYKEYLMCEMVVLAWQLTSENNLKLHRSCIVIRQKCLIFE